MSILLGDSGSTLGLMYGQLRMTQCDAQATLEKPRPHRTITEWLTFDNMHHQWLLLAACFWVIFMFMVASKFITLTFKDPDAYSAKQEFLFLTAMPDMGKSPGENRFPEELKEIMCHNAISGVTGRQPTHPLLGLCKSKMKEQEQSLFLVELWSSLSKDPACQAPEGEAGPQSSAPTGKMLLDSRLAQPLVYMERLELIRNVCREEALRNLSHTAVSKFVLDRIFVCDKHKILFCQTPKVGNTQWKKVLIVLNGAFPSIEEIPENVVHDHEKNGLPRLSSFSDAEIQKRLKTYFKFFIVRDPFERLISAFKDKFVHNPRFEPWYRHEIAPGIIRKYRRNRTETRGIQFEDFVRYLGDPNHRWLDLQFGDHIIHWVTYVELCAPCEITYSVIGHHETLEDDAPYILKEAGIDHLVSYPTIPPGITMYNKTKVELYFLGVSKRDIRRLYARFEGDFKLFGYQKPDFLLN
ncbi:carbohydrate sulfotransferase 10 isoform X2 [Pteropus alecto]|uniref:carbohydrate sulfotransferase 10 isoform X2 n=1 Tax=Pteropus alecto TaxID=9402 RepID=UPI000D5389B9|nr:carbohydrate sulfotransferase 10 isoform X2 [Pteropus alecto]XP_024905580.1 carbohydrate sulfotransferase 10 isoform X2 [Pteropus alecto]